MTFTQDDVSKLFYQFAQFLNHEDETVAFAFSRVLKSVDFKDIDEAIDVFLDVNSNPHADQWDNEDY